MKTFTLCIALLVALAANAQVNLQTGLIAAYPMNNSPLDSTSNHLDLTPYGVPVGATDRFGTTNGAYYLDALTPDYFTAAQNSLFGPAEVTLSAWVNLVDPMNDQKIAGIANVGFGGYLMGVDSNKIDAEIWDSYSVHYRLKAGTVNANTWTHLAISFKANDYLKVYINGIAVDSIPSGVFDVGAASTAPFTVGGAPWQPIALNPTGSIDDIYLYNRVLNPAEISALYNLVTNTIETPSSTERISVFPVPVQSGKVNIDFHGKVTGRVLVSVLNTLGQHVYSACFLNPVKESLDLSRLGCGVYSISFLNNGKSETYRLVIE